MQRKRRLLSLSVGGGRQWNHRIPVLSLPGLPGSHDSLYNLAGRHSLNNPSYFPFCFLETLVRSLGYFHELKHCAQISFTVIYGTNHGLLYIAVLLPTI